MGPLWGFSSHVTLLPVVGELIYVIEGHCIVAMVPLETLLANKGCLANPFKAFTGSGMDTIQKCAVMALAPRSVAVVPQGMVGFVAVTADLDSKTNAADNCTMLRLHFLQKSVGPQWPEKVRKDCKHVLASSLAMDMQRQICGPNLKDLTDWLNTL